MAMLLGTAGESVPVRAASSASHLAAGALLELDRERDRRWMVQVVGT